ncbi:CYFA0S11e04214g1_1 [Cyberlindnera fabianii]|uniref:CYFA0S11e04214g1_1 n=1 Tax=Cyberlindnera fabianii TaxID=36022 RepID=A0A061B0I2_CYBFA|nr:Flavin carrier protein 2 [Cyberlindnera fabianii]CDR43331.1 CYFA0S11e04214g1_1 [Cyberlindnera fabianii]
MQVFQLFLTLFLLGNAVAEKYIKTSSLLTCMADSQLTATYFDVKFYPSNSTVVYDVNALTTITGNVVAKVSVIVYGLNVIERDVDLCDLGLEEICPISAGAGRIDISSNIEISESVSSMIPGIAYTVPDLDARVRVIAYNQNDTDTPLACVEAVLSNGKTVQTKYASWPIAAISGLGLITSGVISVIGHSNTAAHIASNSISLFVYFQNLAITSMMGVSKVPPIAAAWAQNFQWSMGIISAKFMQNALKWYVQATGGTSTVVIENKNMLSISVQKRDFIDGIASMAPRIASAFAKRAELAYDDTIDDTNLYNTDERNTDDLTSKILVLRGIQRVSYLANIEISNFFLTGIVFFLFFLFVLLILIVTFKGLIEILIRSGSIKQHKFHDFRKQWSTIIKGTLFRLVLIAFPQISLLCLWQLTERDSAAIVVVAIFMFVIVFGLLLYGVVRVIQIGRKSARNHKTPAYLLYGDAKVLNRFGFLYVQFQAERYWWLVPMFTYLFLRSIFVALLQEKGKAQALCIFIIELVYFVALCWKRPYMDKRTNAFNIMVHLINFINSIIFLFFSNLFGQPAVVSSVSAVVFFVVNAVFALFLLIFTIVTCILAMVYKNPDTRYQPMKDDRVSFIPRTTALEKSDKKDTELLALGESVLSGQQPQQLQLRESESDEDSTKFPQGSLPRDRANSLNSANVVQPASAVYGTQPLSKPAGVSFTNDTAYHGSGFYNDSNSNNNSSSQFVNNPYENPYAKARQNNNNRF